MGLKGDEFLFKTANSATRWNETSSDWALTAATANSIWLTHTPQTTPSIYYHGMSDDTVSTVIYWMWKRCWHPNISCRRQRLKRYLLIELDKSEYCPDKTNPCVQFSANSHNPLHRTNLKVKDWRGSFLEPSILVHVHLSIHTPLCIVGLEDILIYTIKQKRFVRDFVILR